MKEAPETALSNISVVKRNALAEVTKKFSAHQEMKKNIREKHSRQCSEGSLEGVPKRPPKRACSGYIAFSKEIFPTVKE